jgi:hypothetical protein
MKRIVAGVLTVALMGILLWSGMNRPVVQTPSGVSGGSNNGASDPAEVRLASLLQAAWNGDVAGYLDCFSGTLRQRLEREVNERGRDVFAADLKRAARSRKSHAIFAVEPEGTGAARITVETVYPDRNERQTYHLAQESAGWLVNDVETIRSQVPKAKFGMPATYQEPEGVPVQGLAVQGIPLRVETDLKPGVDGTTDDGTERADPGTRPTESAPAPNPNP